MAEQQEDIDSLKRRGRRRLVGAVALVLAAVIVLPMVFDPAPKSSAPPVSVRIPGEDDAPFKPKLPAKSEPATPKAEVVKPEAVKEPPKPEKSPDAERARAEAALKGGVDQYYVPVGAFSNPQAVLAKLTEAKVPYYTEELAVKAGKVTRVRAGPFASKGAAESAVGKLKDLGLQPGNVALKSG
jgi:DedD protein